MATVKSEQAKDLTLERKMMMKTSSYFLVGLKAKLMQIFKYLTPALLCSMVG